MTPLSLLWDMETFFTEARRDLDVDINSSLYVSRANIIHMGIHTTVSLFYDILANAYMTPVTILPDTTGRYSSSGTGSYAFATRLLTFATMNTSFGSGDVGKYITFRVGALVYSGQISRFVSTTVVEISGHNLPSSNVTVDYVLLASTTPTGNLISIADLPIMRTGNQLRLELESTATKDVLLKSSAELRSWRNDSPMNASQVVWALSGAEILLDKAADLSTYGTFTLRYPRVPMKALANTDKLDISDGAPVEIALIATKKRMGQMLGRQAEDFSNQLTGLITSLLRVSGAQVSGEIIKEKLIALR
jgi:hypothetical protein